MKHIIYILAVLAVLVSCKDDETVAITDLTLDKSELTVGADGASEALEVSAPERWYASADQPWVSVTPASGIGVQQCTVVIDSTLINDMRTARITFMADGFATKTLTVRQTGYGNIIRADSTTFHLAASQRNRDERHLDIEVTTNVACNITVSCASGSTQWLTAKTTEVTPDRSARPRTTKLRFDWTNNTETRERTAEIIFTPKDPAVTLTTPSSLKVIQAPARHIEDTREGDSLTLIAMAEAMDIYDAWPTSEKLDNWGYVRLWEKSDKNLPCPEAVGRVRDVVFYMVNIADGETLPAEVKHLKYLESISYYSNVNSFLKTIHLGTDVCSLKHLRSLEVFAIGITDLPDELLQLSGTLESLKLACNNLNEIPSILTKANFPKLKTLELHANRRWTLTDTDLRKKDDPRFEGGLGLYFHTSTNDALKRLLLWDTLEELVLSYNFIEGQVPDFRVGEDGVAAWSQADADEFGRDPVSGQDTIQWLVDNHIPKILPKAKRLTLNLNFFTGNMPDWLLYHPKLMEWSPEVLIFNQQENGIDSEGTPVRFSNEPKNFEYYFEAFPLYRKKYEIKEEDDDATRALIKKYSTDLLKMKNRK